MLKTHLKQTSGSKVKAIEGCSKQLNTKEMHSFFLLYLTISRLLTDSARSQHIFVSYATLSMGTKHHLHENLCVHCIPLHVCCIPIIPSQIKQRCDEMVTFETLVNALLVT